MKTATLVLIILFIVGYGSYDITKNATERRIYKIIETERESAFNEYMAYNDSMNHCDNIGRCKHYFKMCNTYSARLTTLSDIQSKF